jgi:hypothetical protein
MNQDMEQDEYVGSNKGYYSQPAGESSIQIRLDTSGIRREFEFFLRGDAIVTEVNEEGQAVSVVKKIGTELMNDKGIQCCLMTLSQTINSQAVQGYWKAEYFEQFVHEVDVNFSSDLMLNLVEWNVSIKNYNVICNAFMNLIQQFQSRLIDNKERESYYTTFRSNENTVIQPQANKSKFSIFGGG